MRLPKAHNEIDLVHRNLIQAFGFLPSHADAQLLHGFNQAKGNYSWFDSGAEDARARRSQLSGGGFGDLAQVGVVAAKEQYVSLDTFAGRDDLQVLAIHFARFA